MDTVPYRRWLAGLLLGALAWTGPARAQPLAAAPAPDALASAQRFTELCSSKLRLAPAQASALHTYLEQEVNYLDGLARNGLTPRGPALVPSEAEQLDQVLGRLVSAGQLRQFRQLAQTAPAQACLRRMALLPEAPASLAKGKPRRRAPLVAQRLDGVD